MNPSEQRARHSAVQVLAARQDSLETVLQALAAELVAVRRLVEAEGAGRADLAAHTLAAITEQLTARLEDADAQRAYVDAADTTTRAALEAWRQMTLGARLRWIVRGA